MTAARRTADEIAHGMWTKVVRDGEEDLVAVEEPLEIRVDGVALAVTMRTPGHDEEVALGFLVSEGLIDGPRVAGPTVDLAANTIEVEGPLLRDAGARRFYTTFVVRRLREGRARGGAPSRGPADARARRSIARCSRRCRIGCASPGFERTGGLHATGLFAPDGDLLCVREDVGRHNAMDKVVGRALLDGALPLHGRILCVSGRQSFELVQKAAVAGAPILVGVGAPSSLAVSLAADRGMTLAGFARRGTVNVYTGAERVR